MPITTVLVSAAIFAATGPSPRVAGVAILPTIVAAAMQPSWRAVHTDTVSDLVIVTEALGGRVRFTAHGVKGTASAVTTPDFSPDSVRTWLASVDQFAATSTGKPGDSRTLGGSVSVTTAVTPTGQSAFGLYVQDATSDQQLALALSKPDVAKLTSAIRSALDTAGRPSE